MLKLILLLVILSIISTVPYAFAQISIGVPAEQVAVNITISEDGSVHVVHLVKKSESNVRVELVSGTVENLQVKDGAGNEIQHAVSGNSVVTILPPTVNFGIEYDLKDALFLDNGLWTWEYLYVQEDSVSSAFFFPEGLDLVFANRMPVNISDAKGMNCHGCKMLLEYIIDEPVTVSEIQWEGQKFPVLIRSLEKIDSLYFNQPSKTIGFQTSGGNHITLIIPLELLWEPYEVYLNDEKILRHQFNLNSTHVWVNLKPQEAGTIQIIGISAIPEFSMFLPLVLGISLVLVFQMKNKINLR